MTNSRHEQQLAPNVEAATGKASRRSRMAQPDDALVATAAAIARVTRSITQSFREIVQGFPQDLFARKTLR